MINNYSEETSVPSDQELIFWGWTALQISHLRQISPDFQRGVLEEYIKRFMENSDSDNLDF